jgi:hypothetical protein
MLHKYHDHQILAEHGGNSCTSSDPFLNPIISQEIHDEIFHNSDTMEEYCWLMVYNHNNYINDSIS